jgi:hypothetical protein
MALTVFHSNMHSLYVVTTSMQRFFGNTQASVAVRSTKSMASCLWSYFVNKIMFPYDEGCFVEKFRITLSVSVTAYEI